MEKEREGRMDPLYLAASNPAPSRDRHLIWNTLHACAPCKMCREKHRLLYALNEKGGGGGHGTGEEKSFLFNPLNDRASERADGERKRERERDYVSPGRMLEEDLLFAYMSLRSLLFAPVPVRAELYFHRRRESRGKVQYCVRSALV